MSSLAEGGYYQLQHINVQLYMAPSQWLIILQINFDTHLLLTSPRAHIMVMVMVMAIGCTHVTHGPFNTSHKSLH